MYSLVLMTAMTTGAAEAPQCIWPFYGFFHRPVAVSYYGCTGCCGGYRSYWGGCYGCSGCTGCVGCTGCTGCVGYSVYPGYRFGYFNGRGMPVEMIPPTGSVPIYVGDEGIWAGTWSYSGVRPGQGPSFIPTTVGKVKMADPMETSAKITIDVPDNAKLYIDGQLMNGTSNERYFYTPPLEKGQSYYYDVRIEMVKDGKIVADAKKVIVQAGAMVKETFKHGANAPAMVSK